MAQLPPAKISYPDFNFPQPQLPNQTQPSAPSSLSASTTTLASASTSSPAPSLAPSLPSAPPQGLASTPVQALTTSQGPTEFQAPADTSVLLPDSMAQPPPAKMCYRDFNFPQPQLPNRTQPSAPSSLSASTTTLAPALTSTPAPSLAPSLPSAPAQGLASTAAQALTASRAPTESQAPADTSVLLPVGEPAPLIAPSNSTCLPEPLMYKNRLQEYAQKSGIQLPVYHTINEGFQHSPMFRSTVYVDGAVFTSTDTFSHRKTAEQSAAKIALDTVLKKMKDEGCPLIYVDVVFCKSILNEFAVKTNMEKPAYKTIRHEGQLPVFVSSLSFNGILYTGDPGKNKKEAEQLAARAVIMSLLGKAEFETVLSEIIRSKSKLLATFSKVRQPCKADANIVSSVMSIGHNVSTVPEKDKGVEAAVVVNTGTTGSSVQPISVNSVPVSVDSAAGSVVAEASSGNHRPHHEFRSVKSEPFPEVNLPNPDSQSAIRSIEFVHAAAEQPTGDGHSSAKRRRRNRRKANKRMRTTAQLSVATLPLNQAPACSVAQ